MRILTEKETEAVKQLRQNVSDLNLNEERRSDDYLVRWLRARDHNMQKAEEMLRNHMKWREANNADSILDWEPPEIYYKMYPNAICGYTEEGIPVAVMPSRFFDIHSFWEMDLDEYTRYGFRNIEALIEANRKRSKNGMSSYEFIGIYDLGGMNVRDFMNRRYINYVQTVSKQFDENYPELMGKAYFAYAPAFASVLFAMVRHFLPKRTVAKFVMCGSDPEKIRHHLTPKIPIEVLPTRYGGLNQEFEDTAFKNCGRNSMKRKVSATGDVETDGFIESHVPAGQKINFTFDIDEPKSTIKWCFKTENYDIGFAIHYTKEESTEDEKSPEPEVIRQLQRVNSQEHKQTGSTLCERTGKYIFLFDNTFSRMRSKTLHLHVDIISPSGENSS